MVLVRQLRRHGRAPSLQRPNHSLKLTEELASGWAPAHPRRQGSVAWVGGLTLRN